MAEINVIDLGLADYEKAKRVQDELIEERLSGKIPDTLVLCEHNPVITIGRKGGKEDLLVSEEFLRRKKIRVYHVERGGEATYHCPGQLVGYPIFNLRFLDTDLHRFLRKLEEIIINTLKETGVDAQRREGYTGVWVPAPDGPAKIAFIGISARRWVTYHGFSLNVDCDLTPFEWIVPCGIKDAKVTSIKACQRVNVSTCQIKTIKETIIDNFNRVFKSL